MREAVGRAVTIARWPFAQRPAGRLPCQGTRGPRRCETPPLVRFNCANSRTWRQSLSSRLLRRPLDQRGAGQGQGLPTTSKISPSARSRWSDRRSRAGSRSRTRSRTIWLSAEARQLARVQRCVETAATAGYSVPTETGSLSSPTFNTEGGEVGGRVLLPPNGWNVGFVAPSDAARLWSRALVFERTCRTEIRPPRSPVSTTTVGDLMSGDHVYASATASFAVVGLDSPGRTETNSAGFPRTRSSILARMATALSASALAPLEAPSYSYYSNMLIRIPFNFDDPFNYYTVEYRRNLGWSAGIPSNTILIHEVRNEPRICCGRSDGSRSAPGAGRQRSEGFCAIHEFEPGPSDGPVRTWWTGV